MALTMRASLSLTLIGLLGIPSLASADGKPGDCPHVYKKPPPTAHKPRPIVVPPAAPKCKCEPGEKGDAGEAGPQGPKGDTGERGHRGESGRDGQGYGSLTPAIGVMGFANARHGDWGWGPALEIRSKLSRRNEFVIDAGLALPITADPSPGREEGLMLHAGLTHYFRDSIFGVTGGVYYSKVNGSSANGEITGRYLGLDGGLVMKKSWDSIDLRLELSPTISGLRDTHSPGDTQLAIGITSSVFLGVIW